MAVTGHRGILICASVHLLATLSALQIAITLEDRMNTHKNSPLTPKGRLQMVRAVVDDGMTVAAAARRYHISTKTVNKWVERFLSDDVDGLRDRSSRPNSAKPTDGEELKKQLFTVLHAPPSDYGFNRTTWKLNDLHQVLEKSGTRIGKHAMRKVIRDAGYRWLKARKVLTSNDPDYRDKVDRIHRILSGLQETEGFFSIDEFGPFAVKQRQGKKLVAPGEVFTVPQWQKSKGSLIVTAALELFTNQITHFYSEKKNSEEMVKLLNLLLQNHRHLDRIYLSWDAAPWHESNKLFEKIESNNVMAKVTSDRRPGGFYPHSETLRPIPYSGGPTGACGHCYHRWPSLMKELCQCPHRTEP